MEGAPASFAGRILWPLTGSPLSTSSPLPHVQMDDCRTEFERLKDLGVRLTQEPTEMGPVTTAVLDDTCGNLVQIHSEG